MGVHDERVNWMSKSEGGGDGHCLPNGLLFILMCKTQLVSAFVLFATTFRKVLLVGGEGLASLDDEKHIKRRSLAKATCYG